MPRAAIDITTDGHVHTRLSNGQMMRIISLILLGSGVSLYIKALG